ncbi:hypothetical protein [Acinetobacter baumannii]|uniref:hypothetical protein n=1 Tax=Acinetobacter baumannii TaxID=470 RepID=UPI003D2EEF59
MLTNDSTPASERSDPATVVVNVDGTDYPGSEQWRRHLDACRQYTSSVGTVHTPITVTATDAAGNAGTDTAVVTIDTTAPNALDPSMH